MNMGKREDNISILPSSVIYIVTILIFAQHPGLSWEIYVPWTQREQGDRKGNIRTQQKHNETVRM